MQSGTKAKTSIFPWICVLIGAILTLVVVQRRSSSCHPSETAICLDKGGKLQLGARLDRNKFNRVAGTGNAAYWYSDTHGDIVAVKLFGERRIEAMLAVDSPITKQRGYFPNVQFGNGYAQVRHERPNARPGRFHSAPGLVERGKGFEIYYLFTYCSEGGTDLKTSLRQRPLAQVIIARPGQAERATIEAGAPCSESD